MNMRNYVIGVVGVIVLIGLVLWFTNSKEVAPEEAVVSAIPTEDRIDVVSDFYATWLDAVQSSTTDPYQIGLADDPVLGQALSLKLKETADAAGEDAVDPVLCQSFIPTKVGVKPIFEQERDAQYVVIARGEQSPRRAEVTVTAVDGKWQISDIVCTDGESAPEREFTFERSGNLLKSVPEPLDPQYWHLVFEENGTFGNVAPLFFDETSQCIDGETSVCNPDTFRETQKVRVFGQMTEAGVAVARVEFVE